jgi:uncharacterized membrane protein YfcA
MPIFLPIAGISANLLLLLGAGLLAGVLSGLTGVGGGFLLTPMLIMMGIPPMLAAASGSNSSVATSASGVSGHFRLGNVDLKLGTVLLAGGLIGAAAGVEIIEVLEALGEANFLIRVTYILVLAGIGSYMLADGLRAIRGVAPEPQTPSNGAMQAWLEKLPWQMSFPRSGVRHSLLVPLGLCVLAGILTAIMGIGGGFLLVPMMIYLLRIPLRIAVGTSLFQILFTCVGVTYMQAITNRDVDLLLAMLLGVGSALGAQLGVRLNRSLRGEHLKVLLASLALAVSVKMAAGLVMTPTGVLSYFVGHTP